MGNIDFLDRYKEEARILMSLFDHSNIVKCYGYIEAEGSLWIIQELCEGGNLQNGYLFKSQE